MAQAEPDSNDWVDRRPKYDWDRWLDGRVWTLRKGEDFTVDELDFRTAAYPAAVRRGLKVRTRRVSDDTVQIQAYKAEGDVTWK